MSFIRSSSPISHDASQTTLKRKFESLIEQGKTDRDFATWAVSYIKSAFREEYPDLLPSTQPDAFTSRRQRRTTSPSSPEEEDIEEVEQSDTAVMRVHSRPKQRVDHYLALKVVSSPSGRLIVEYSRRRFHSIAEDPNCDASRAAS